MGRRAQANARTLSWQVRQVFQPVIAQLPATSPKLDVFKSSSITVLDGDGNADELDNSEDLIPTQLEVHHQPSDKSLGKRKSLDQSTEPWLHQLESGLDPASDDLDEGIVTSYTKANLPPALNKYWSQRYRLFSRYDQGIQMDYDGWFSVTPENIAAQIAERCRCGVVVDAFCGVGGNSIQFAMTCEKVIAIDTSAVRLACARANAYIYGVESHIEFVQADFVQWARERAADPKAEKVDVVFMSPPWGGIDYSSAAELASPAAAITPARTPKGTAGASYATYPLSKLAPLHGKDLFDLARTLTKDIAYYLPRNLDIHEAASLVAEDEIVEVEEEWTGSKLKALCLYYGDLAN